ncbi:MAG: hypothetical protein KGJ08_01045 [Gammaproteobacteria bacterium]|nr:hypothetical protein [Gammaproteobacteria bacterium]
MSITLFIPSLNGLHTDIAVHRRYPALETFLARSRVQNAAELNAELTKLYGLPAGFGVAPFMRLADTGKRDAGFYFRADPVHLAPDRDQLVMLPLSVLQVQMEEAQALAETFNRTYAAEGYRLETPYPERWYLRVPAPLECVTHEPVQVSGGSVFEFMPQGEAGQRLRQLMNEIQMLFHEQPVNLAREASGRPSINSLWLWGGGSLPETTATRPGRVLTDIPLVTGLALFAGSHYKAWTGKLDMPMDFEDQLIAIDCAHESALMHIEDQLAVPLLRGLREGQISALLIYPGNQHSYRVTRTSLRQPWRRRRPLPDILRTT